MPILKEIWVDPGVRFAWGNTALLATSPGLGLDIAIAASLISTALAIYRAFKGADEQSILRNSNMPLIVNAVLICVSGFAGVIVATTPSAVASAAAFLCFGPANLFSGLAYSIAHKGGQLSKIKKFILKASDYFPPAMEAAGLGCVALATTLSSSGGGWMQAILPAAGALVGGALSIAGKVKEAWWTFVVVNMLTGIIAFYNAYQGFHSSGANDANSNIAVGIASLLFAAASYRLVKLEEQKHAA